MIDDRIKILIAEIKKLKGDLRGIKKDIKEEEKIDTPEYVDLMRAFNDLKRQVNDYKDQWLNEIKGEEMYVKLRELKVAKEEEIAEAKNELFSTIAKLQLKPVDMNTDSEEGPVRVQIMPEMRLYLNGREEKR